MMWYEKKKILKTPLFKNDNYHVVDIVLRISWVEQRYKECTESVKLLFSLCNTATKSTIKIFKANAYWDNAAIVERKIVFSIISRNRYAS